MKAQISVEQLIMLGIGLAVIGLLVYIATNIAADNQKAAIAKYSVQKIASTADFISSMDRGTKLTIEIEIPKDMRYLNISEKRVVMRVGMSNGDVDFFANTRTNVIGSISATEGRTTVFVEKLMNDNVMIGENSLECIPYTVYISAKRSESGNENILLKNSGILPIQQISGTLTGNLNDMITYDSIPNKLEPNEEQPLTLYYNVPPNKELGTYNGILTVTGTNNSQCIYNIYVNVEGENEDDQEGPIASTPTYIPQTPTNTDTIIASAICDDTGTGNSNIANAMLEIDYSGIWNPMNATGGNFGTSPIQPVTYTVGSLSGGTHYISVICIDTAGNVGNTATTSFFVDGPIADVEGPLVYALTYTPLYPNTDNDIIINATGDDRNTGNSNVSSCQIELDGSNLWKLMTPINGQYGSSNVLNLTYNLGKLNTGTHTVRVRCMDTFGNVGSTAVAEFQVYVPDYQGPVVSSIISIPANPTTADKVTIIATANDTGTGNSSISGCMLQQDNQQWLTMIPITQQGPVQNYSLNIGLLSPGRHNIAVKCTDVQNNVGTTSYLQINVTREILFIYYGSPTPTTNEQYWINWLYTRDSNESYLWKMDIVYRENVESGTVDINKYKIVVIAYSQNAESDKWLYINKVIPFKNSGKYVILLGQALQYGLGKLSLSGTGGSGSTTQLKISQNHYITRGFTIGQLQTVLSSSSTIYYATGSGLTQLASHSSGDTRAVILDGSYVLTYGVQRPDLHTTTGDILATRIFDYALMNSN